MINTLYRTVGNFLSPGGAGASLSILIYHRVLPEVDELFPTVATATSFDTQLDTLKKVFNVLPLGEAVARLKSSSLPPRAACITFDDGYEDNVRIALPILQHHGLQATFFIATAYLNGGHMFNDRVIHAVRHSKDKHIDLSQLGLGEYDIGTLEEKRTVIDAILKRVKYLSLGHRENVAEELVSLITDKPLPNDLMMTTEQLKALSEAGMEIGGHTARHPILAKLDEASAIREIREGKDYLEGIVGKPITLFAYPNGKPEADYLAKQVDIPRRLGFEAAVSTRWGVATRHSDLFQLPRFTPYSENPNRFAPMLLQNLRRKDTLANKLSPGS
ncbi:MAG: polysaccharide deacetylase family protein [Methylococcaceae bacterium]|nr:polysaccharide deacetylase family protein [Methylococcaceae bacterium]